MHLRICQFILWINSCKAAISPNHLFFQILICIMRSISNCCGFLVLTQYINRIIPTQFLYIDIVLFTWQILFFRIPPFHLLTHFSCRGAIVFQWASFSPICCLVFTKSVFPLKKILLFRICFTLIPLLNLKS